MLRFAPDTTAVIDLHRTLSEVYGRASSEPSELAKMHSLLDALKKLMVLVFSASRHLDKEVPAQKLLDIAYNTALRRLDKAWMANAVVYRTPFLDAKVVAFAKKIPMEWKIYGDRQVEKFVLREAFRDMLPEKIANREKLRFAMGVGTDDVMDMLVSRVIDPEEIKSRPTSAYGMPFATFKELLYYDEFLKLFPPAYEKQPVRWDPFK